MKKTDAEAVAVSVLLVVLGGSLFADGNVTTVGARRVVDLAGEGWTLTEADGSAYAVQNQPMAVKTIASFGTFTGTSLSSSAIRPILYQKAPHLRG